MARQPFNWSNPRRDGSGYAAATVKLPKPAAKMKRPEWLGSVLAEEEWLRVDSTRRFHHQRCYYRSRSEDETEAEYLAYRIEAKTQLIVEAARVHPDLFNRVASAHRKYIATERARIQNALADEWTMRANPFRDQIQPKEWNLLLRAVHEKLKVTDADWSRMSKSDRVDKLFEALRVLVSWAPTLDHISIYKRLNVAIRQRGLTPRSS
jgi:hypothetical protein